jgi:sodium transport system permease protein
LTKEVVDNLRDRRALMASLFYPIFGPLLLVFILVIVGRSMTERAEKPLDLPVAGGESAPTLLQFLEQNGVVIQSAPVDPEAAVRSGEQDLVLVIPEGFPVDLSRGRPATVQLVVDHSRNTARQSTERALALLERYSATIGRLRLLARGISPTVVDALAVEEVDVATAQSRAAMLLGMAPYFIILAIFIGGMYLTIDATAGERERGSLEPLLLNPAPRSALVLGKTGAAALFSLFAVMETLVGFAVVLNYFPLEKYVGVRMSLDTTALLVILVLSLPMVVLAVALQISIATFTRSFKEAQNYLSLLPLVPAIPGLFLVLLPVKAQLWMMLVPTYGQQLLINKILRGEPTEPLHVAVSALATILLGGLMLLLSIHLFEREKVIFGR